jgi:hypothetical protein
MQRLRLQLKQPPENQRREGKTSRRFSFEHQCGRDPSVPMIAALRPLPHFILRIV